MTRLTYLPMCFAVCALVAWERAPAADQQLNEVTAPYRIVAGKVDDSTFLGWRAYHSACHTCHGPDAVGTAVAPSLVERVKSLSARDFTIKVLTSYRIVAPAGDPTAQRDAFLEEVLRRERGELTMPAWESEEKVRPHVLDLYAYLRARADGALGPGRPKKMDE